MQQSTKRAVFFERVSTQRQAEKGVSLETMKAMAEEYAAKNKIEIVETILEVVSGRKVDRAGIRRLEELARTKAFDILIVYKIDRLSRRKALFHNLLELFQEKGIGLVSLTQPLDTTNAAGRLLLDVLISFASFEAEMISERVHDNLAQIAASGRWTGGKRAPTGYRYDKETKRLEIDEQEATIVRQVFATFLETQSVGATCRRLNKEGTLTAEGKFWTGERLRFILRSPWYAGYVSWRKTKQVTGKQYQKRLPKDQHLVAPGTHEAIVTVEDWQQVQMILDGNRETQWDRTSKERPWGEVMRCAGCGARMQTSQKTTAAGKRAYYRCTSRQFGKPCEGSCRPTILFLERYVLAELSRIWDRFGVSAKRSPKRSRPTLTTNITPKIKALQDQIDRARQLFVLGEWDMAAFQAKKAGIEEQIRALASVQVEASGAPPAEPLPSNLAARWASLTSGDQRTILREFVETILVDHEGVRVILKRRPEPGYPDGFYQKARRVYLLTPGPRQSK